MHILLATSFPFPGTTGSPIHTMQIARGLAARGHAVTVVKYSGTRGVRLHTTWEGIDVHHVPLLEWPWSLPSLLRTRRPDVCYAHGDLAVVTAFPITKLFGVPMVHEVHSLPVDPGDRLSWNAAAREQVARRLARHVDAQIVLSQRVAAELERRETVARHGYRICYPPTDLSAFRGVPRPPRDHAPVIVYAGNFMPYQGVDLLVAAAPRVWEQRPDARFRIVGGTRAEAQRAFAGLGGIDDDRIEFVGRQPLDAMPALLGDADVLVIPRPDVAENRTTSRKLGEYLATGRVIVATDVADHRRILEEHDCGIVVSPSSEGVARGVLDAIDGSEARARAAARAVQTAEELFGLDRGIVEREAILADVAHPRRAARGPRRHGPAPR